MSQYNNSSSSYKKTRCLILNVAKSGEADKLLLLSTEKFGKIMALAPGALKPAARLSSALEPLRDSEITLWNPLSSVGNISSNRFHYPRITSALAVESFPALISDKDKISEAFECARIYDALVPYMEPDEGKGYALLRRAFVLIAECPQTIGENGLEALKLITTSYDLRLLRMAGYDFCKMDRDAGGDSLSNSSKKSHFSDDELKKIAIVLLRTDGDTLVRRFFSDKKNFLPAGLTAGKLFLSVQKYIDAIAVGKV